MIFKKLAICSFDKSFELLTRKSDAPINEAKGFFKSWAMIEKNLSLVAFKVSNSFFCSSIWIFCLVSSSSKRSLTSILFFIFCKAIRMVSIIFTSNFCSTSLKWDWVHFSRIESVLAVAEADLLSVSIKAYSPKLFPLSSSIKTCSSSWIWMQPLAII